MAARDPGRGRTSASATASLSITRCRSRSGARRAGEMLAGEASDLVYVNSLAASVFAVAAARSRSAGRSCMCTRSRRDMFNLLAHDVTKIEVMRLTDAAVFAAEDIRADLREMFHAVPTESVTFGVAVEIEAIRAAAMQRAGEPAQHSRPAADAGARTTRRHVRRGLGAQGRRHFPRNRRWRRRNATSSGSAAGGRRRRARTSSTTSSSSAAPAQPLRHRRRRQSLRLHADDGPVLPVLARGPEPAGARRGAGARRADPVLLAHDGDRRPARPLRRRLLWRAQCRRRRCACCAPAPAEALRSPAFRSVGEALSPNTI